MSDTKTLRPGWKIWRFDQIAEQVTDRAEPTPEDSELYIGLEHMDPDSLKIQRWGSQTDLIGTKFRMRKGDILFARRNAYLKRVAIAPHDGLFSAHGMVLRPQSDAVLPDFLPFFMQSDLFMDRAIQISVGSLSPTINWKTLAAQEFLLPPPTEQHRLVELLRSIDECLNSLAEADLVTRRLENARLEDALRAVPADRLIAVDKLVQTGPKNGLSPKANSDNRGYPTLSIGAVRDGRILVEGYTKYAEISDAEAATFALKANDVLVVRGNGNKLLTGKCGLVDVVPEGCFYPDLLIRLQFDAKIIRPEFAALQWNSSSTHSRLISRAKSTNGIWKINGADIRQHTLKVPKVEKQDALLAELRAIRSARKDIAARKESAQNVKLHALRSIENGGANGL